MALISVTDRIRNLLDRYQNGAINTASEANEIVHFACLHRDKLLAAEPPPESQEHKSLAKALEQLLNAHSRENASDTPDFILSQFLMLCLTAFEAATRHRDKWYDGKSKPEPEDVAKIPPPCEEQQSETPEIAKATYETPGRGREWQRALQFLEAQLLALPWESDGWSLSNHLNIQCSLHRTSQSYAQLADIMVKFVQSENATPRKVDNGDGTVTWLGLPVVLVSETIPAGETPAEVRSAKLPIAGRWLAYDGTVNSPYPTATKDGNGYVCIVLADKPAPPAEVTWTPPASLPDGDYVWTGSDFSRPSANRCISHVVVAAFLGADWSNPPKFGRYRKTGNTAVWIGE